MFNLSSNTPWEISDILSILPHRYPFLLVDRVIEISGPGADTLNRLGRKMKAIKQVTYNEPFFPGHFPLKPIMPGVLQIEALAQVCALVGAKSLPTDGKRWEVLIGRVNECKFRMPVVPGDTLELNSEILRDGKSLMVFKCSAKVNNEIACELEIMAKLNLVK